MKLKIDRPENVKVYHREEGSWVDRKVMKWYVENVLGPWSRKIPEGKRGLLLIDGFEGHFSTEINALLISLRIDVKKLPANTSHLLQPMDLSVNSVFKQYYSSCWDDFQFKLTNSALTKTGYFKPPRREDKLLWVSQSWGKATKETVTKGF